MTSARYKTNKVPGARFHSLVLLEKAGKIGKTVTWRCRCDCGRETIIRYCNLGKTKTCGCARSEATRKSKLRHGMTNSVEYHTWSGMRQRCRDVNTPAYPWYGGRGIKVCERWDSSFENFYSDMGKRPGPDFSLDRINNDGDYEPSNCRWVLKRTQSNNRRPRHRWRPHSRGWNGESESFLEQAALGALSLPG